MISEFKQIEDLFMELDNLFRKKIEIYAIGGAVLLHQKLKLLTKDIDIVVKNKRDFVSFQNALIKAGFNKNKPGIEYKKMNLSYVFTRDDFRIDLFLKKVCSKFLLSEAMMNRAKKVISLNKISVFTCSKEDIFLFKTMTERAGDLEDCKALVTGGINWETIKQELLNQIKQSDEDIWITWVGERLDLLIDMGINIPVMKEIDLLREKYFLKLEKELEKKGLLDKDKK